MKKYTAKVTTQGTFLEESNPYPKSYPVFTSGGFSDVEHPSYRSFKPKSYLVTDSDLLNDQVVDFDNYELVLQSYCHVRHRWNDCFNTDSTNTKRTIARKKQPVHETEPFTKKRTCPNHELTASEKEDLAARIYYRIHKGLDVMDLLKDYKIVSNPKPCPFC